MRRHYSNYLKGLPGIKEFRNQLVTLKTIDEVEAVLDKVKKAAELIKNGDQRIGKWVLQTSPSVGALKAVKEH